MADDDGWVTHDALVESLPWGRNVYTVLRVPEDLADAARAAGTRRVEGTVEDVEVNLGVNRADVLPDSFFYAGAGLLRRLGARPGDVVRCRLRPADPDVVPLADDVRRALVESGRLDAFESRRPAERRRLLAPVEDAVRPETRERRLRALLDLVPPES